MTTSLLRFSALLMVLCSFGFASIAQITESAAKNTDTSKIQQDESVVIQRTGNKDGKMTILVDGDKITAQITESAAKNTDTSKIQQDESIIIQRKGNKNEKMTIVVDGDKITINGKPAADYKGDINVRSTKTMIRKPMYANSRRKMVTEQRDIANRLNRAHLGAQAITTDRQTIAIDKRLGVMGKEGFRLESFPFNTPKMGIQAQDVESGNGVKVLEAKENSPAAKAGLMKEDILTAINGEPVISVDDAKTKLLEVKEGDTVKIDFLRGTQKKSTEIKLPKKLKSAVL